MNKYDLDSIRLLTSNGIQPIVDKWLESFDSVYTEKFEQFITSDKIIGHFVGFVWSIFNHIGIKDNETFTRILYSTIGYAFSNDFKDTDDFLRLMDKPLSNFLNNHKDTGVLNGQFVATFFLKKLENPEQQYYQTKRGKMRNDQTYFFLIENAAEEFLN